MTRLILLMALALAGCVSPATAVKQPLTARPASVSVAETPNGSIYNAATSRPLFEDRRARFVGDTITVNLVEKSSGSKATSNSNADTGSVDYALTTPTVFGVTPGGVGKGKYDTAITGSKSLKSDSKGAASNASTISGTVTVTVIEVLPNGNLLVSGEKQLTVNSGTEFIRISGVVNPVFVTSANTINSTQLADAIVESKDKTSLDLAQVGSLMAKFFFAVF